jgi:hypothetical protein
MPKLGLSCPPLRSSSSAILPIAETTPFALLNSCCKEEWDDAAKPVITELLSVYEQHWSAISSILPKTTGRAGPVHHKLLGSLQQEFSKANGVVSAIGKMAEELVLTVSAAQRPSLADSRHCWS